jgi:hypothetical protein
MSAQASGTKSGPSLPNFKSCVRLVLLDKGMILNTVSRAPKGTSLQVQSQNPGHTLLIVNQSGGSFGTDFVPSGLVELAEGASRP